jgi:hypothetical protein
MNEFISLVRPRMYPDHINLGKQYVEYLLRPLTTPLEGVWLEVLNFGEGNE